jgi:hypothetical protein
MDTEPEKDADPTGSGSTTLIIWTVFYFPRYRSRELNGAWYWTAECRAYHTTSFMDPE